jgi:hypothetical protein
VLPTVVFLKTKVGFGMAGAGAALEAAELAKKAGKPFKVVVLDRFSGGGATKRRWAGSILCVTLFITCVRARSSV